MSKSAQLLSKFLFNVDPYLAKTFVPWACMHKRYLKASLKLSYSSRRASNKRKKILSEGIKVPPFLICSITSKCNLRCSGCFAGAAGTTNRKNSGKERLTFEDWKKIIRDARSVGVFGFVIAGGEPFLFPNLLRLCKEFDDRFFIILTNGTMIKDEHYNALEKMSNVAILVSLEGGKETTDSRRGDGVHDLAIKTLANLSRVGTPNGISVTITRRNFSYWSDEKNIDDIIRKGVTIAAFIEYIPLSENDTGLMLTKEEREKFRGKILGYRENKNIYLIHSPGDEEYFGGCVSAGRGFSHVTPNGDLTPCPVSNIATHNLKSSKIKDALASPLFEEIRENESILETDGMPCALFAHPKEVDAIARKVDAYRSGS